MMARSTPNAPQMGRIHWCKTQRRFFEVFLLQHTAGPYISDPFAGYQWIELQTVKVGHERTIDDW